MRREFTFLDGPWAWVPDPAAKVAWVEQGITTKEELLEALSTQLGFPEYFGRNWDALLDMLRDLSWIRERRVAILHDGMPELAPAEVRTYLRVLQHAMSSWGQGDAHILDVIFTADAAPMVARLL